MHGLLKPLPPPFYTPQSYRKVLGACGQDSFPQTHSSVPETGSSAMSTFITSHPCSKTLGKWWDSGHGTSYATTNGLLSWWTDIHEGNWTTTLFVTPHKRNIQNCLNNIFLWLAVLITCAKSSGEATALLRPTKIHSPGPWCGLCSPVPHYCHC